MDIVPLVPLTGGYLIDWCSQFRWGNRTQGSYRYYVYCVTRLIVPAIGDIPLTDLRAGDIARLLSDLQDGLRSGRNRRALSATTVRHVYFVLRQALDAAARDGLIASNPARRIEPPQAQARDVRTWSLEEARVVLGAARGLGLRCEALCRLVLTTGIRAAELASLRWCDIDFNSDSIAFRSQALRPRQQRLIRIDPGTMELLRRLRDQEALAAQVSSEDDSDTRLVFPNRAGSRSSTATVSAVLRRIAQRAGVSVLSLRDVRLTCVALLLWAGAPPHAVRRQLGLSTDWSFHRLVFLAPPATDRIAQYWRDLLDQ